MKKSKSSKKTTPTKVKTSLAKRQSTPRRQNNEPDSTFFLKLVMYFIFGTLWIHVGSDDWLVPIPLGFLVGMAFATHDHFQIDRKIEYAVLVVAMFVTYFLAPRLSILF